MHAICNVLQEPYGEPVLVFESASFVTLARCGAMAVLGLSTTLIPGEKMVTVPFLDSGNTK